MPTTLLLASILNLLAGLALAGLAAFFAFATPESGDPPPVELVGWAALGAAKVVSALGLWWRRPAGRRTAMGAEGVAIPIELAGVGLGVAGLVVGGLDVLLALFVGFPAALLLVSSVGAILYLRLPHVREWYGARAAARPGG